MTWTKTSVGNKSLAWDRVCLLDSAEDSAAQVVVVSCHPKQNKQCDPALNVLIIWIYKNPPFVGFVISQSEKLHHEIECLYI